MTNEKNQDEDNKENDADEDTRSRTQDKQNSRAIQRVILLSAFSTCFTEFWSELSLTHSCGKPGLRHRAFGKVDAEEEKEKDEKKEAKTV